MYINKYKFKHGSPLFPETCGNSDYSIIAFGNHLLPKNKKFEQVRSWTIWKEHISFQEFFSGLSSPQNLKAQVYSFVSSK